MVYHSMPQRSARSITANTNHPPQDPPPTTSSILVQLEKMVTESQINRINYLEQQISFLMIKYGVTI